jgi:UDP-glucose 4-epimerase
LKKIIITGGNGYIGSHTAVEFIEQGYQVHIIDNLSNSDESIIDRIYEITGTRPGFTKLDLRDKQKVQQFFKTHNDIQGIVHFAALKSVGESVKKPMSYFENNVVGFVNLLEAVTEIENINLVFSSSCTVYGSPTILPVTEDAPIGFTPSPYGATKQMCERILDDFSKASNSFKGISLRYFNPLGAHDSRLLGELPTGVPNNLLPYITQTAAGIRDSLSVFGFDYNTPDGTAIRDYIHVTDLAEAHVKAMEYLFTKSGNLHEFVNIGTGNGLSVLEVIRSFEKTSGLKINYKLADRREGDVESIFADPSKAESLLNWKAKKSIDEMTKSAWEWEKKLRKID